MVPTQLTLVMPPQHGLLLGFAAGLISLANYINDRKLGVQTDILDLSSLSQAAANSAIASFPLRADRRFVGITTTTASYQSALSVAEAFRKHDPECILIMGGHHVSADTECVIRTHAGLIDAIVIGEGERALAELLQKYPNKESIPGIAFLDEFGQFQRTPPPSPLTQAELDSIDIVFRDRGLVGEPGKFNHVTYVSARGCPLKCAFCAVSNEAIRSKGVSAVVQDIESLLEMGFTRIALEDNFFAHTPARTLEICRALADVKSRWGSSFNWDCQTRVEALARDDTVDLLQSAGCDAVYIGVESFIPQHLVYLNKTLRPQQYLNTLCKKVVPRLLESTIDCYINVQFGLPGETVDDNRRTELALRELGALASAVGKRITLFPQLHVLYPGTAHFSQRVGASTLPSDIFETFTQWESIQEPVLMWLGEHFAHGTGGIPIGIMDEVALSSRSFQIDSSAVARVSATLKSIDRVPGIEVFMYGDHLVK